MDKTRKTEALNYQAPEDMLWRYMVRHYTTSLEAMQMTRALFEEVKKYLVVVAAIQAEKPSERVSPPREIDDMWHHFILDDTERYFAYCTEFLGRVVHHHAGNLYDQDKLFRKAKELGIELDNKYWGPPVAPFRGVQCG